MDTARDKLMAYLDNLSESLNFDLVNSPETRGEISELIDATIEEATTTRKVHCPNCGFEFGVPKASGGYLYCPNCKCSAEAM